ncbi:hypothetical protein LTR86_003087 [Recurvomyces mirabilis]|nr:hypothetical protein LTR86_003087 [Recurvomyces mirabilis]
MRLLNVSTLQFREFFDKDVPAYAILSHRWSEDEVTYKDFVRGGRTDSAGHRKVLECCELVRSRRVVMYSDGADRSEDELLQWVWIDTICIDKRSSAELSEAINSMFAWYRNAEECIVYLPDVALAKGTDEKLCSISNTLEAASLFRSSEWWQRGWTLQELLAPPRAVFFTAGWDVIGHKCPKVSPNLCNHHSSPSYG